MKKIMLCLSLIMLINLSAQTQVLKKVRIDRKIETQLVTLFDKKPQRIELFSMEDNTYLVEASYDDVKLTKHLSADEYLALIEKQVDKYAILENARVPHLIGQSFLGLSVYSWSLPMLFNSSGGDFSKTLAALGLLTPLAYSGCIFGLTSKTRISAGAAYGSFVGGIEGAAQGFMIFNSARGVLPISLAENIADYAIGQQTAFTPGMFQRKFNHVLYGHYQYFMFTWLAEMNNSDADDMRYSTIAGLIEGYASLFLSRRSEYLTYGDALFELRASEIGGQTIPLILTTVDLYDDGSVGSVDARYYAAGSLAGFAVGYYVGNRCSVKNDLSGSSGFLTYLIPWISYLAVGGITVLIDNDNFTYSLPAVASIAEIALTSYIYRTFSKKSMNTKEKGGFYFMLNPAPVFCKNEYIRRMPIAGLSMNF